MKLSDSRSAVQERADGNVVFVNGTKDFTLEQVYDKLFQKSYEEWLAKERKKSRAKDDDPPTYYEKIEKDKKKHLYPRRGLKTQSGNRPLRQVW